MGLKDVCAENKKDTSPVLQIGEDCIMTQAKLQMFLIIILQTSPTNIYLRDDQS